VAILCIKEIANLLSSGRRSMTSLTPSVTGTLGKSPILHLLVSALEHVSSGTLVIETPAGARSALGFNQGIPTKFKAAEPVERFGSVLVTFGWLDESASEKSFGEASVCGMLHGEYLVKKGILSADVVALGLRCQMLRKLSWACTLDPSSVYGLYDGQDFLARWAGVGTPLSPLRAAWQLAREMPESATLLDLVGRFESQAMRFHPRAALDKFGFDTAERAVLDLLKARPQTLTDLTRLNVLPLPILHRAIYVLALTRQLELGTSAEPIGLGMNFESIHEILSQRSSRPNRPLAIAARPIDSTEAINTNAHESAASDCCGSAASSTQGQEVVERRTELQNLFESLPHMDFYELLGINRDATTNQIQIAFFELAKQCHPDKLGSELADMREVGARVFSRLTDAQQTLSDLHRRAEYDQQLLREPKSMDGEQERIQLVLHAATSFQKAEVLFKKRMFAAAELEAKRASEDDPEQADYLALLAWIRANKPNMEAQYPQVLEQLNEAVKMAPESAKNRFYRAQVLSRLGRHREAVADYRFVVSKNPHHIDALREIRIWEMRRKGQESSAPGHGVGSRSSSPASSASRRPSDPRYPARMSTTPAPSNRSSQNPSPKGGVLSKFFKR
jgi:curved DNA-binding protein CbpA